MYVEPKDILTYPKYAFRNAWYYFSSLRAWKNTIIIIWAFRRTIVIGSRAIQVLISHVSFSNRKKTVTIPWSWKTRGRYIWRVAHKFWAPQILGRAGIILDVNEEFKI